MDDTAIRHLIKTFVEIWMEQEQELEVHYSSKDVAELCRVSGLQPTDLEVFQEDLNRIAVIHQVEAERWKGLMRNGLIKKELRSMLRRFRRLADGMEKLSADADHALSSTIEMNNSIDFMETLGTAKVYKERSLFIPIDDDSSLQGIELNIPEFKSLLGGIERAAEDAVAKLPKKPKGQMRDFALHLWMRNIQGLWERHSQTPFTRDATSKGEPISPAARFCVAAFLCIDPDYSQQRILLEMKRSISEEKARTGKITTKKD